MCKYGFMSMAILLLPGLAEATSAQAVVECMAANVPERSFRQAAVFRSQDASGASREIQANFAGMRKPQGVLLNIGVKSPVDVAGTAVLIRRDDNGKENIKLYLPALRRVRNVSGGMASQNLLGTDFSYRDIKDIFAAAQQGELSLLPGEGAQDEVHRLEVKPTPEQESPYSRVLIEVDKAHCVPLQLHFESAEQGVVKHLQADPESLHEQQGRFMLLDYTMRNLAERSTTRLKLGPPKFDDSISRSAFNPASFYNYNNRVQAPE